MAEHGISHSTREFVNAIVTRAAEDPEGFAEDLEAHRIIRDRELRLKSKRARLAHRAALEDWNGFGVGSQFDFRWGITKSFLDDIDRGLRAGS